MERRQFARKRVLLSSRIVFNNGYCTMNCQIRNAGKMGMGLRMESTRDIPDHIRIMVDRDQSIFNADVRWRSYNALGIQIVGGAL